ncbi:methyltransferase domain-containing protein [Paraglaciecola sp.]|uniref:class I SAM-dependent methyltransferase n=1 Tax=Paraglaciecola sp. TaxID=1920173 RepID=UPI003265035F
MGDYWSQYWRQGHLTSFSQDIKENYKGGLFNVWRDFFAGCNKGDHVLDVGTGNGALIDIALKTAPQVLLTGIDSAELTLTESLKKSSNVNVYSRQNAENMVFEANTFDSVISQFGIEYADMPKALSELARVLKIAGRFQLVLHDMTSSIVQPNSSILSAAKELSKPKGVLECLKEMLQILSKEGKQSKVAEASRTLLNTEIKRIADINEVGLAGSNFPNFLRHCMSPRLDAQQKLDSIDLFQSELLGQIERLTDLLNAALTVEKYVLYKDLLYDLGLNIKNDYLLTENDQVVARVINGYK